MNKVESTELVKIKTSAVNDTNQLSAFEWSSFSNPPSDYRPVVFWSWNEVMEPDEVRRQLRLMKEAGLGGGFIHSRIGLLTDYLGSEWFEVVKVTIEESKKLGFKVYLYDEDKWPSGFAGGMVPLENEAFRMKALIARPKDKAIPESYTPIGSSHSDIQVYRWVSPLGYDWFNGTCYGDLMSRAAMQYLLSSLIRLITTDSPNITVTISFWNLRMNLARSFGAGCPKVPFLIPMSFRMLFGN